MKTCKHLMIGTPVYLRDLNVAYVDTLFTILPLLSQNGIKVSWQRSVNDAVNRQRNHIVARFLASTCDRLLFLDADMGTFAETILQWCAIDLPVICANYPARTLDWTQVTEDNWRQFKTLNHLYQALLISSVHINPNPRVLDNGFIEVLRAGCGCKMIQREVFEKLIAANAVTKLRHDDPTLDPHFYRFFEFTVTPEGEDRGEDHSFDDKVNKFCCNDRINGAIWCDPKAACVHVGPHEFFGWPQFLIPMPKNSLTPSIAKA